MCLSVPNVVNHASLLPKSRTHHETLVKGDFVCALRCVIWEGARIWGIPASMIEASSSLESRLSSIACARGLGILQLRYLTLKGRSEFYQKLRYLRYRTRGRSLSDSKTALLALVSPS